MQILVVNAGSSSLKLRVLADADEVTGSADLPPEVDKAALEATIEGFGEVHAVGHRIVHGGDEFSGPVLIDPAVRERIGALTDLAPLHQPKSLAALDAVTEVLPDVPAVACFDTAFHATIPPAAATFALPAEWRERWSLRRFGFHGLSHAYVSRRAADLLGVSSLAPACGWSAATSARARRWRRCGTGAASIPRWASPRWTAWSWPPAPVRSTPGSCCGCKRTPGYPPTNSPTPWRTGPGLLGLAGTADLREILARAAGYDAQAELAREVYLHRLAASVAAMTAALGGLDALVFTGGVGENSAEIRSRATARLGFLGVHVDDDRNGTGSGDRDIGPPGAPVRVLVISAREDIEIARQVREVCGVIPP